MNAHASNTATRICAPLDITALRELRTGARVLLTGVIYAARDAAHKRLVAALEAGASVPMPLANQVIYYVGPAPPRPGALIGPAGPTTSGRMDPYTVPLLEAGLKGMIGKGNRSAKVREAMLAHQAVYFVSVGGAAALVVQHIRRVDLVAYEDLGTEAIRRLEVEDLPLVVANDLQGNDLFEAGRAAFRQREESA